MDASSGGAAVLRSLSWASDDKGRKLSGMFAALALVVSLLASVPVEAQSLHMTSVIVRADVSSEIAADLVEDLGGVVGRRIGIINGFEARVPVARLSALRSTPGILAVSPNGKVYLSQTEPQPDPTAPAPEPTPTAPTPTATEPAPTTPAPAPEPTPTAVAPAPVEPGSMYATTRDATGASTFWAAGLTGAGVDVAVIDSGIVPVDGLSDPAKIVNAPDFSFESQDPGLEHLDSFGHGTHMSGIIAGKDVGVTDPVAASPDQFVGMAPDSRIVNVKAADFTGATDVSQVLAALDWVVQHRNVDGLNIKVLNLSFGTDGVQSYLIDPLTFAAEQAWHKGITVVVSGGNEGFGTNKLNNPAYDPYVIAVGATNSKGTADYSDDNVPDFSSCGNSSRRPDLVAPGKSIISLKSPGSYMADAHPQGWVGDRYMKGSGTSQAAAVVSGAAALIIQQRPGITPDQVKALLMSTAKLVPNAEARCQGDGAIDLRAAFTAPTPSAVQTWERSTGTGSLDAARGTVYLTDGGVDLRGEIDIFGAAFDSATWAPASAAGTSWNAGMWNNNEWISTSWTSKSWSSKSWSSKSWSSKSWSSKSWSSSTWSSKSWSSKSWSGSAWSSKSWSSKSWSTAGWSTAGWGS